MSLVGAARVEAFEDVHVRRVVVPVELEVGPVFMPEHAGRAILTLVCLVERSAVVCLEFVAVAQDSSLGELGLGMGEAALVLETALGRLNPVAAELSLLDATIRQWHERAGGVVGVEVVLVGDALSATFSLCLPRSALEYILVGGRDEVILLHGEVGLGWRNR